MKKVILPSIIALNLILLSGCNMGSSSKIVCTGKGQEMGFEPDEEIVATLNGSTIDKASLTWTFDNQSDANTVCEQLKSSNSAALNSDRIDFSCSGKTIKVKNFEKMSELAGEKIQNISKAEFIENMRNSGLTCN